MAGVVSPTAMGHPLSKKVCEDVISILVSMSLYYFFRHRSRDIRRIGGKCPATFSYCIQKNCSYLVSVL